jgi:hypothetical protein
MITIRTVDGSDHIAETVDLGITGIRFRCVDLVLQPNDVINLTFSLWGHTATVAAKVLRTAELGDSVREVAVAFVHLPPAILDEFCKLGLGPDG